MASCSLSSSCTLEPVDTPAALASDRATRPPLPPPSARAPPLIVGSGLSPFKGRPETEDLRPNPARRYNRGVPLDPELLDELRAAVG